MIYFVQQPWNVHTKPHKDHAEQVSYTFDKSIRSVPGSAHIVFNMNNWLLSPKVM